MCVFWCPVLDHMIEAILFTTFTSRWKKKQKKKPTNATNQADVGYISMTSKIMRKWTLVYLWRLGKETGAHVSIRYKYHICQASRTRTTKKINGPTQSNKVNTNNCWVITVLLLLDRFEPESNRLFLIFQLDAKEWKKATRKLRHRHRSGSFVVIVIMWYCRMSTSNQSIWTILDLEIYIVQ